MVSLPLTWPKRDEPLSMVWFYRLPASSFFLFPVAFGIGFAEADASPMKSAIDHPWNKGDASSLSSTVTIDHWCRRHQWCIVNFIDDRSMSWTLLTHRWWVFAKRNQSMMETGKRRNPSSFSTLEKVKSIERNKSMEKYSLCQFLTVKFSSHFLRLYWRVY